MLSVVLSGFFQAVTSLCWQRSKPYVVNESNCTSEIALLGGASEDSILMPDPRPSVSTSSFSTVMLSTSRSSQMVSTSGSTASLPSTAEETPIRSSLWRGGSLAKLQAPRETVDILKCYNELEVKHNLKAAVNFY
ncbi:hypothetical protein HPP92_020547 [Vanilla planifolia]|uniref:Secreted protein n=1 Tax=Vanilla planifolia TaxID=51239 RepID=A0A835Q8P4_VANPL|nr:hypothetical protein HPP92_020547 [Vanilla planifolia]